MTPLYFRWDGDNMVPRKRDKERCDRELTIGELYILAEEPEERSLESHQQYFASLHDAWLNLPEDISDRFLDERHFRKWCLIACGYRHETVNTLDTAADAMKFAYYVGQQEPYCHIAISGVANNIVTIYRAKTQKFAKRGGMGKGEFQKSKTDVLDLAASLIGVTAAKLTKEAERHA